MSRSRLSTSTGNQLGSLSRRPIGTLRTTTAASSSSLSARGSRYDPNTVFLSCIRAIIPSNASLAAAATNAANASHRNISSPVSR